jgi:hypothetical protein
MTEVATLIDGYIATWNEKDPERRLALIAETFSDGADYLDPLVRGEGQEGINAMIAAVQQNTRTTASSSPPARTPTTIAWASPGIS